MENLITFDGWYMVKNGQEPFIPWTMMLVSFVAYTIFMSVLTALSISNSKIENIIQGIGIKVSNDSAFKIGIAPLSMIIAVYRMVTIAPLGTIFELLIIAIPVFIFAGLLMMGFIKYRFWSIIYAASIIYIQLPLTWHHETPVFIVPVTLAFIFGFLIGRIKQPG